MLRRYIHTDARPCRGIKYQSLEPSTRVAADPRQHPPPVSDIKANHPRPLGRALRSAPELRGCRGVQRIEHSPRHDGPIRGCGRRGCA